MKTYFKFLIIVLIGFAVIAAALGIGSVPVSPRIIGEIILNKVFAANITVDEIYESIFWKIRLPRVLLAFMSGSALAVGGVIMQSVLRNPLASSYTLGVSSGAAVGASFSMIAGLSFFGALTTPFFGLLFGLLTVFGAIALAAKIDRNMQNTTIILTGMAFSFFANSIISFLMAWSREDAQRLIFWQLGSFARKDWSHTAILFPALAAALLIVLYFSAEMDIMTFGEEQAKASGVNVLAMKWLLLAIGAVLTGVTVSLVGVIGFVDLFTPHVARKIFGSRHRYVLPASALLGGLFMALCDLAARTVTAPIELPVGAVSSAIGAPFFVYVYFKRKKEQ